MKLQQKQDRVRELMDKLSGARAFYLTDFTGLDVKSMTDLRARLRGAGVEYLVVKNTLAQRALAEMELPDIQEHFVGPTGLVIGLEDAVSAARVLTEFAQDHGDRPSVKIGVVESQTFGPAEVNRLAKLPPRDQLYAELAGALEAPIAQVAFMLQSMLGEVVGLLEALRAQRESA